MNKMLTKMRKEKGWSGPKLAKEAGVSTQQVHRLETGEREFTRETAISIGGALGVPPHTFMPEFIFLADEQEALNYYRELEDKDKKWVIDFLKSRVESQKPAKDDATLIVHPPTHAPPSHKGKS